jgi:nitrite reductase/ring-hydroxylating ferredoxin subunit
MTTDLVELIENVEAIDKAANPLADAVGKVLPAGPVKDTLSGTKLGHPLHPVLTDVVIGAWSSSVFLDLVGGEAGEQASDRLLALGIAAAVPTAVTGISDWADTWGKARRIGLVHAWVNVGALLCFCSSMAARKRGSRTSGRILSLAGSGVMTLGAYLGGHLSFRKGVGVDETVFEEGPSEWTQILDELDLPEGTPVTATVDGVTIMLYRSGGVVRAIADRCSHRGGPLHEGECDGQTVTCPWHGSRFRLTDGSIVRGPAVAPQPRFEIRVTNGKVEVRRDPSELHA